MVIRNGVGKSLRNKKKKKEKECAQSSRGDFSERRETVCMLSYFSCV